MAIKTDAQLKALFETGNTPTYQDFSDLIESKLSDLLQDFPNPLPAVSGENLTNIGDALPDPLPPRDGSNLSNINPDEYNVPGHMPLPSYATATTFVLTGNFTISAAAPEDRLFLIARRLRLQISGAHEYTEVANAVFAAGITTITTLDNMSGSPLEEVALAVITPFALGGAVGATAAGAVSLTKTEPIAGDKTWTGQQLFNARATMAADIRHTGIISPAQITANQNDYAPTGHGTATLLRLDSDAARNITGLAGGASGIIRTLHNVGAFGLTLTNQDAASAAANRFALPWPIYLAPNMSVMLWYDATSSRWRAHPHPAPALGEGQTWQNMTGSRAFGTNYQNTTGRSIEISVIGTVLATNNDQRGIELYVGTSNPANLKIQRSQNADGGAGSSNDDWKSVYATIPNGWWYRVAGVGASPLALDTWHELRT